jgi:hypothetical protein
VYFNRERINNYMKDQDQQLLWEAYVTEKSKSVAKGSLPRKARGDINDEDDDDTVDETTHRDDLKDALNPGEYVCPKTGDIMKDGKVVHKKGEGKQEVQEEGEMGVANAASEGMGLDLARWSAEGRKDPASMIFDAVIAWMENDSSGLVTPEDQDGYSVGTAFDDAKDFIKGELADISLSAVKERMNMDARQAQPIRAQPRQSGTGRPIDAL